MHREVCESLTEHDVEIVTAVLNIGLAVGFVGSAANAKRPATNTCKTRRLTSAKVGWK